MSGRKNGLMNFAWLYIVSNKNQKEVHKLELSVKINHDEYMSLPLETNVANPNEWFDFLRKSSANQATRDCKVAYS